MTTFYAYVEHREWGEPDRVILTGPYEADDVDTLAHNLIERGEVVTTIVPVAVLAAASDIAPARWLR